MTDALSRPPLLLSVATLALTLSAALPGCAPGRANRAPLLDGSFSHALAPESSIEYATPGRALVIPLRPPASATNVAPSVFASIDGGDPIPGAVYRLRSPSLDADSWLGAVGRWQALPAESATSETPAIDGIWVAVLVLPPEARPPTITINARIVRLTWLDVPQRSSPSDMSSFPSSLDGFLVGVRDDPTQRWRERLLRERLRAAPSREPPLSHPALELLAVQMEDRWRAGLLRLRTLCGEALADTVLRTLTAFAVNADGMVFPIWPTDPAATGSLLGALLDHTLPASAIESRARAFLAAFPPATAWVQDDAGAPEGVIVGLADLAGSAAAASLSWRQAPDLRPEMVALQAFTALTFPFAGAAEAIDARIGAWTTTLPTLAKPIVARPPGVTIAPLRADHHLESWRAGVEQAAASPTYAILRPALASTGWELFLQCAGPPSNNEHVRIYLGPTGAPTHILRITPEGAMLDERSPVRSTPLVLASSAAGWSVTIPIPPTAISSSGEPLRIAIERTDAQGRRSAWPRAMLPWQRTPGRAAIDLSSWSGP